MNIRDTSWIERGLHSERTFLAKLLGVDLTYLFKCPLSEVHMMSLRRY